MLESRLGRWAAWHILLWAVVVAGVLTALGYWAYTPDDGFIHMTFIRNLVSTGTFTFSGGVPVNGSTSPLWNMIGALLVVAGASPLIAVKILGYAFTVATVVLASYLAFRISGPAAGWTVGWVLGCDPWLMRWAVSGLETSMAVALILAALVLLHRGRPVLGCVVAGLLPLARPETVLFVALFAVATLALHGRRRALQGLPWLALPSVIWGGYAWAQFGDLIQNSVRSKTLHYSEGVAERAVSLVKIAVASHGLLLLVAGALVVTAAVPRSRDERWTVRDPFSLLLLAWPLLLVAGLVASGSAIASRYLVPGTVIAYLPVAGWLARQSRPLRVGLPLASCLASLAFSVVVLMPGIREYSSNFNRASVEVTDALNRLARPGDVVAARDIGYLGYYNRVGYTILDLAGLVTPEMLERGHARDAFVLGQQPRFIVDRGTHRDALAERGAMGQFEVDAYADAGALRFEAAALLGPPGLNAGQSEWYTLYSVDTESLDRVFELAGAPD